VKLALWRLGGGLVALPVQIVSLFLVIFGAGEAVGALYRRLLPPAGRGPRRARTGVALFGCLLVGVPVAAAMSGAAAVIVVSLVRMAYYPFWAASAAPVDLRHSWGGPTPLGATAVHWLVGAVAIGAADLVLRGGGYLMRRLVLPPSSEDQPAGLTRPGSVRRSSAPVGRRGTARPR
jgi:hypothetical protein